MVVFPDSLKTRIYVNNRPLTDPADFSIVSKKSFFTLKTSNKEYVIQQIITNNNILSIHCLDDVILDNDGDEE